MESARDIAASVAAGQRSALEVAESAIARIESGNGTLNALVRFDPDWVRQQAAAVDARRAAGAVLPLAGVPIVVKDNIWVGGRRVSQGSRLFADFVAPDDATAVSRLRAAGAVIAGIGNCPEFACKGQTNSPLHGLARNPCDPALTPGGSSGGNAAAIAAGFVPIGLGTDGGGSGRRPPAHTGTVGFKPSFGAIPYGPGFPEPFWAIAVLAPMARSVMDAALLFGVVAGPCAADAESISIATRADVRSSRTLRIAYAPRLGLEVPVDPDVTAALDAGIAALSAAGFRIEEAAPAWPASFTEADLMPLQMAGLAALHGEAFARTPELFDPDIARQIEQGLSMQGRQVTRALEASHQIRRALARFFESYDALLCPTAPCVAWSVDRLGPAQIGGVDVPPRGHAVFTPFFNHALAPSISIPCGRGRAGLPVGLQLAARRGMDWQLLALAADAEAVLASQNA